MSFTAIDVTAAGMVVALGAALPGGASLSTAQCAAVKAIAERLHRAETLIAVAADSLTAENFNQRDYVMQKLREFEERGLVDDD